MNPPDPSCLVGRLVWSLDWKGWRIGPAPRWVVGVETRRSGTWVRLENGRMHLVDRVEVVEEQ